MNGLDKVDMELQAQIDVNDEYYVALGLSPDNKMVCLTLLIDFMIFERHHFWVINI